MSHSGQWHARELARNLVDLLTAYEEEFMVLEAEAPAIQQLRRAVGIAIAEAHYWISDQGGAPDDWPPRAGDDRAHQANP